jgi:hypothetical protein
MRSSVWAVHFFVFAYAAVPFAAYVQQAASVAISTQHFFASIGTFRMVEFGL